MKYFLIHIYCLITLLSYSQDSTIFKSGFEENIVPTYVTYDLTEINTKWFTAWSSPDIYSTNSTTSSLNVPINYTGYQMALKDSSYAGFLTYYLLPGIIENSAVEWLGAVLPTKLIKDKIYCFRAYVSLADTSNYATGNIGAYFSPDSIYIPFFPPPPKPLPTDYSYVVSSPASELFTDKIGWTEINLTYQAKGDEQYMYIGNFAPDSLMDYDYLGSSTPPLYGIAYYYIDEVSLTICNNLNIKENTINETITLYPNPNTGQFTYAISNYDGSLMQLVVTDLAGRTLITQTINQAVTAVDANNLANGIYVCSLIGNNGIVVNYGKVSIQR